MDMRATLRLELPAVVDPAEAPRPRLRVAVVTETYPPEVNGAAVTLARAVQGLRERGHAVQLVRPRQRTDDETVDGDTLLARSLPIPGYPGLRMGLPAQQVLRRAWSRQRPDVVHIATEGPLGYGALRTARALALPVTSDFRTNFHSYSRHYGVGWLQRPIAGYLRHFHNATHCTMVPTAKLRDQLEVQGFDRLVVVGRGVDTAQFDPARRSDERRRQWGAAPDDPVAIYVGRLAPEKNLDALLRAHEAMLVAQPRARLVLVGDGPMREALRARCPQALFAGEQRDAALAECYASGDVFLFPSVTETFGNVTPEAMASGLAVVAFDHAAASQLITSGHNGYLAPMVDVDAFVAHAVALVRRLPHARALGRAARRDALRLGWERVVDEIEYRLLAAALRSGGVAAPGTARPSSPAVDLPAHTRLAEAAAARTASWFGARTPSSR